MTRFQFTVDVDMSGWQKAVDGYLDQVVRPAAVEAVNTAAFRVKAALDREIDRVFDNPSPFTKAAIWVLKARSDARDPAALVRISRQQAAYLGLEVLGGPRRSGDYATTPFGPLVPGKDAAVNQEGNLPRTFVKKALARGAEWMSFTPGKGPQLVERTSEGLQFLAVTTPETDYQPRFGFYQIVADVALLTLGKALSDAIAERAQAASA